MNPIVRKTVFTTSLNFRAENPAIVYRVLHGGWWFQETFYHDTTGVETCYNYRIEEKQFVEEDGTKVILETLVPIHEDWIIMPCFQDPIVYPLVSPLELGKHPLQWATPSFEVIQSG